MSIHKVITDIRRLCSLGLGGQMIMPSLLQMIHELVPSHSNVFLWADADGGLSNLLMEPGVSPYPLQAYLKDFYNSREAMVRPTFTQAIHQESGVVDWEQYYNASRYLYSDLYNTVMRPQEVRYTLRAYVPAPHPGACPNLGVLVLRREPRTRPFSERDKRNLASILAYVSHALCITAPEVDTYTESNLNGMIVINSQGFIQHADSAGLNMLFLACNTQVNAATMAHGIEPAIAPVLKKLADSLSDVYQGLPSAPPSLHLRNDWGLFTINAHLLNLPVTAAELLIGVTIQLREPRKVTLVKAMQSAPLSAKQKEVCLWLLEGLSQIHIAERMGISPHSVNDYLKKTYRKLEVHSKDELLKKLLSPRLLV